MKKLKTGIIGSGKIGTDLQIKLLNQNFMEVSAFVGRREDSEGIQVRRDRGVSVSIDVNFLMFDILFKKKKNNSFIILSIFI